MPLQTYDTQINSVCQPFTLVSTSSDPKTLKSVYSFESNRQTSDVICPFCRKKNVYAHARHSTEIKDFPDHPKHRLSLVFHYHGYKCRECGQYFTEDIPEKIPHARITCRAAEWINGLEACYPKTCLFLLLRKLLVSIGKQLRKSIRESWMNFLKNGKRSACVPDINRHTLRLMNLPYTKATVTLPV